MNIGSLSDDAPFPIVVTPSTPAEGNPVELKAWLLEHREEWTSLLLQSGGILFRSFNMVHIEDFQRITEVFCPSSLNYVGGNSPRRQVMDKVYTSTEFPSDQVITLHNEMSYAQTWPARIVFWCDTPAESGGETPIIDSRLALQVLPKSLVERFERKGVIYSQTLHGGIGLGRSWQATFETDARSRVEEFLSRDGIDFEWTSAGGLRIRYRRKALENHPTTGETVWFCQADQWHPANLDIEMQEMLKELAKELGELPHNVIFGDGSDIPAEDIRTIRSSLEENSVIFPWEKGDVLLLDNILAAHGRRPFSGKRKVLVAMG